MKQRKLEWWELPDDEEMIEVLTPRQRKLKQQRVLKRKLAKLKAAGLVQPANQKRQPGKSKRQEWPAHLRADRVKADIAFSKLLRRKQLHVLAHYVATLPLPQDDNPSDGELVA